VIIDVEIILMICQFNFYFNQDTPFLLKDD